MMCCLCVHKKSIQHQPACVSLTAEAAAEAGGAQGKRQKRDRKEKKEPRVKKEKKRGDKKDKGAKGAKQEPGSSEEEEEEESEGEQRGGRRGTGVGSHKVGAWVRVQGRGLGVQGAAGHPCVLMEAERHCRHRGIIPQAGLSAWCCLYCLGRALWRHAVLVQSSVLP